MRIKQNFSLFVSFCSSRSFGKRQSKKLFTYMSEHIDLCDLHSWGATSCHIVPHFTSRQSVSLCVALHKWLRRGAQWMWPGSLWNERVPGDELPFGNLLQFQENSFGAGGKSGHPINHGILPTQPNVASLKIRFHFTFKLLKKLFYKPVTCGELSLCSWIYRVWQSDKNLIWAFRSIKRHL